MPAAVLWIMVIMVSLVVGFLGGWLLEYYLDLKYWEMRAQRRGLYTGKEKTFTPTTTTASTAAEPAKTNEELTVTLREFLEKREQEIAALRQTLERQEGRYDDLEHQFERYMATHPDELTAIRGIGRIYQWKLRDGGISSYEQLARATPEQLREILEVPDWRKFEPESWIEQAKVLAQRGE
jgi:NADH-quinone oxidoreductase subunit E